MKVTGVVRVTNRPITAHQAIGARIVAQTEGGVDGVYVFDVELA